MALRELEAPALGSKEFNPVNVFKKNLEEKGSDLFLTQPLHTLNREVIIAATPEPTWNPEALNEHMLQLLQGIVEPGSIDQAMKDDTGIGHFTKDAHTLIFTKSRHTLVDASKVPHSFQIPSARFREGDEIDHIIRRGTDFILYPDVRLARIQIEQRSLLFNGQDSEMSRLAIIHAGRVLPDTVRDLFMKNVSASIDVIERALFDLIKQETIYKRYPDQINPQTSDPRPGR